MTDLELYFNGKRVTEEEMNRLLNDSQARMVSEEQEIAEKYGISNNTAAAIMYLRTRSRWTQDKEDTLIERDLSGNPISLGKVLSGEF